MRMEEIGPWLGPAFLGPFLSMTAYVTVAVFLFGQHDPLLGGPFANWCIAMLLGAIGSALMTLALLAVDLFRIRAGIVPPTGRIAWIGGALAFAAAAALFTLFPPGRHDGLGFFVALAWPIALAAVTVRYALAGFATRSDG